MNDAEDYVRGAITQAVSAAGGRATPEGRATAAKTARVLVRALFRERVDERLATDMANVITRRLDEPAVVRHLLRALVCGCPSHEKLAGGIERLAEQARGRSLRESLWHLVCTMIETPPWATGVRAEWASDALAYAMAHDEAEDLRPERVIGSWLDLYSAVPDWMGAAIHQRPELLVSPLLACEHVRLLHSAAPTAKGWRLLAGHPYYRKHGFDGFGSELDVALDSLDRALGEERDGAKRLVLARWLGEIGGQP